MMRIFLSFSFRDEDERLVSYVKQLLASQAVLVETGERLGGEQLTDAVKTRIDQSDAVVAVMTRYMCGPSWTLVGLVPRRRWMPSQWVHDEIGFARFLKKPAIALVEEGVTVGGMYQPHEHISFHRKNPVKALLALADTAALWKREREQGRTVKVQVLPLALAQALGGGNVSITCRLWRQGKSTDWKPVIPVPEPDGTYVYVNGVSDDHLLQLQAKDGNQLWASSATSQWMTMKLSLIGGAPA